MDNCTSGDKLTPLNSCVEENHSFDTTCPDAVADQWFGALPGANITYSVKCSAQPNSFDMNTACESNDLPTVKSCIVSCLYCTKQTNLVFNVSVSYPIQSANCTLYLWYNTTAGSWCKVFPPGGGDYDPDCVGIYKDIIVGSPGLTKEVPVDVMSVYPLSKVIAPTVYKWNVKCHSPLGNAFAMDDWVFKAEC
jgi:hypothetical protein